MTMISYDHIGPVLFLGNKTFSVNTELPTGRQEFTIPVYAAYSDESHVIVSFQDFNLTNWGTWNDYYGFGSSPQSALVGCLDSIRKLRGCNVDIRIETTMSQKWCFLSDDAPFYVGSQRICHIPRNWRGDGHEEPDETFVVWKNGNQTDECTLFLDEVQRICALDAAPSRRGGSLRSIFSRKDPVTREAFLNPEKSE